MGTKQKAGRPAKAPGVARGASKAEEAPTVKMAVEAILTNQQRAKRLYQRAADDLAALVKTMRPGQTVQTRFGTVALQDEFCDGKLVAFKTTAVQRYSLRVISPGG